MMEETNEAGELDDETRAELEFWRAYVAEFYAVASASDALHLDALFLLHAAMELGYHTERKDIVPWEIADLELTMDTVEHDFMVLLEAVRKSRAYSSITPDARSRIDELNDLGSEGFTLRE